MERPKRPMGLVAVPDFYVMFGRISQRVAIEKKKKKRAEPMLCKIIALSQVLFLSNACRSVGGEVKSKTSN